MNHSPLTLRRINKLIGQTMRFIQIAPNDDAKIALRWVVRWLNMSRRHYKQGVNHVYALKQADNTLKVCLAFGGLRHA